MKIDYAKFTFFSLVLVAILTGSVLVVNLMTFYGLAGLASRVSALEEATQLLQQAQQEKEQQR